MIANEPEHGATARQKADAWFSPGRFAMLLAAIVIVTFPKLLLGQETFFYRDFGLFGYPLAHYHRECFWRGELPLWNPFNDCGLPFLAQWNTLVLYPPSLFYLIFPLSWSLGVFNLGHLFLAGMGMYFLAHRWTGNRLAGAVAGVVFAFNGLTWHCLMWPNDIAGLGWMPWVVLAVERAWSEGGRRVAVAALAGAMQMLTGAPEIILLTWAFLAVLWLTQLASGKISRSSMLGRFLLAGLLVAGLAAAQLQPFAQLLMHSQRDVNFGDSRWAMPGWGWANFLVPLFHCSPSIIGVYSQNEQQWTSSYYMGIGGLALASLAVCRRRSQRIYLLAGMVVAGVVLSMGENARLYGLVKKVFPLLGVMRFPIKIVVLTVFTLPLLAGFALGGNAGARVSRGKLLGVGVVLLLGIAAILGYAQRHPLPDETWLVTRESGLSRAVFVVLILGAAWVAGTAKEARTIGLAGTAMLLLLALDVLTYAPNQNPTVTTAVYGPLDIEKTVTARYGEARAALHPKLQLFLSHGATPDAVNYYVELRRALYLNCNLIDDLPTTSGFYSLELRDAAKVSASLNQAGHEFPEPLADFLGVSQISAPDTSATWTTRPNFMPIATAGQRPIFANESNILRAVTLSSFDPRSSVYLPEAARGFVHATNQAVAEVSGRRFSAQRAEFQVQSDAPALVVVAQAFYEPWHAYVDGERVRLWEANGAFQALEVPAGRHDVKLIYEDNGFKIGVVISFASLAVLGMVGFWKRIYRLL